MADYQLNSFWHRGVSVGSVICTLVIAISHGSTATEASETRRSLKLRYSEEYIQYRCERKKLSSGNLESLFDEGGNLRETANESLSERSEQEAELNVGSRRQS